MACSFQRALSFLNNDGCLRHNNVCSLTVFVNAAGEWKLGGVEHMNSVNEELGVPIKVLQSLEKYSPPEKADALKQRHITRWLVFDILIMYYNYSFTKF